MRLADIRVGERYAARIEPEDIATDRTDPYSLIRRGGMLSSSESVDEHGGSRWNGGRWKIVEVTAIEDAGVHVRGATAQLRFERPFEWPEGDSEPRMVKEDGEPVFDVFTYEAVVQPSRLTTIEDATADAFTDQLHRDLHRLEEGELPA